MAQSIKPFYLILKAQSLFLLYLPYFKKDKRRKKMILLIISIFLRAMTTITCVIPSMLHAINLHKAKVEYDISENYTIFFGGLSMVIVDCIFPFYSKRWSSLLHKVINYDIFGRPANTTKMLNFCYKSSNLFRWYLILAPIFYAFAALNEARKCLKLNKQNQVHLICTTVVPMWLPFEISLAEEFIIFVIQIIFVFMAVIPAGLICFLIWEVSNMITLHFDQLKLTIKEIINEKNEDKRQTGLKLWVYYHLHILKILKEFNHLTKVCIGFHTLVAALIIAFIMNQVANMNKPIGSVCHLFGWLITLWLLGDAGQKIQDGTLSIGEAVYNSKWYATDIKTQKYVLFIIQRCQKPYYLETLPLGTLKYELMLMIMKTAYSYLTLLKNTSSKHSIK